MRRRALVVAALVAVFFAVSAAGPPPPPDRFKLRLRAPKGKAADYKVTFSQKIALGNGMQRQFLSRSLVLALSFRVSESQLTGAGTIEGTYRSLYFIQSDLTGTVTYDSESPSPEPPSAIREIVPLMGKTFRLKVSPEGRLAEIEGAGEEVVQSLMAFYPEKPLAPGDTWTGSAAVGAGSAVVLDGTFVLSERRQGRAVIMVRADISQREGAEPLDAGSLMVGYGVTGLLEGPLTIEESAGWPVEARFGYGFSGQIELGGGAARLPISVAAPFTGEGTLALEMR